jgi:hypothetical protein
MKKHLSILIIILGLSVTSIKAQSYFPMRNVETNLGPFSNINGQWIAIKPTNNTLGANYYQGINFGFDANNYASLVNGVGTNEIYFGRWSSDWKDWSKIWHSGNLNNINTDFIAKTITSSKIDINGEIIIGTGSVNANTTKLFVRNPAGKTWAISSGTNMVTESSFSIYNWSDNQTQPFFNIAANGNIGIGTTNTIAKLTIRPTSESSNGAFKLLGFTYPSDQSYWSENQIAMMYNGEFKNLLSSIGNSYLNAGNVGNVGIGTTNPDEKLTVNGKIHAKEVKIDLNFPAPDYVFANTYKLKSLQEVEEFIKQNSHLPEIPSAKEIEKNGLMLAEMNMSLLKKIEELTLYTIEQEKKNIEQSKEIETLKKENEGFKSLSERLTKIENQIK